MDSVNNNISPLPQPGTVLVCKSRFGRVLCHRNKDEAEPASNYAGDLLPRESVIVLEARVTYKDTVDTCSVKVVSVKGEIGWTTAYQVPQNGKWVWIL